MIPGRIQNDSLKPSGLQIIPAEILYVLCPQD